MQADGVIVARLLTMRAKSAPRIRKFLELPGGRRIGDRVAYVTDTTMLAEQAGPLQAWREDSSFDERTALRDGPGLQQVLDLARRTGIALCIKG
jgi:hypothetical protein